MFPRISKFQNTVSTTASHVSSQVTNGRRNDSSNIRNLIFGGYEEPPSNRPSNFYPQPELPTTSPLQDQAVLVMQKHPPAPTLHAEEALASMSDIEAKINLRLQEIDTLFGERDAKRGDDQEENIAKMIE